MDITGTANGGVYALSYAEPATLYAFDGSAFEPVVELPNVEGFVLHGSRTDGAIYIGGVETRTPRRAAIYCYRDGELIDLTADTNIPPAVAQVTEVRPGLLFIIADNRVWRFEEGRWSNETGLPAEQRYELLWSHPDCGVVAHGHTTFINNLGQE